MKTNINVHSKPNINVHTGIPFGIIKAEAIDFDLFDKLCYSIGKDPYYEDALKEFLRQERVSMEDAGEEFDEDRKTQEFDDTYCPDEPVFAGEYEGVAYQTTWLGGAQMLYVFQSPVLTKCSPCSPCVPNAGDLDSVGGYLAYGVPTDWLQEDFIRKQCETAGHTVALGPDSKEYWKPKHAEFGFCTHGPFGDMVEAWADCYQKNLQEPAPT